MRRIQLAAAAALAAQAATATKSEVICRFDLVMRTTGNWNNIKYTRTSHQNLTFMKCCGLLSFAVAFNIQFS